MSVQVTSLTDAIKQCSTVQEALLLIAARVESVETALHELQPASPASAFDQPLDWGTPDAAEPEQKFDRKQAIAEVRAQIEKETDPANLKALNAKLWLLRNPGAVPQPRLDEGIRATFDAQGNVVLPPATPERQQRRNEFATRIRLGTEFLKMDDREAAEAYARGGARWLVYGNRDAVMLMPYGYRQALVEDIAEDSKAEAMEVARDILKAEEGVDEHEGTAALQRIIKAEEAGK